MEERKVYLAPTPLKRQFAVKEIFCIHPYWYSPTFVFSGESHEAMELVYVQTGSVTVTTNAYTASLNPGELIVHKPWDFHRIKANNTQCRLLIFTFSLTKGAPIDEICDNIYKTNDTDKTLLSLAYHHGAKLVGGKNGQPLINEPVLASDYQIVQDAIELILINILQSKNTTPTPNKKGVLDVKSPLVLKVINFLEEHVYNKLTLREIAEQSSYSVSRISSIFQKETGDSVINYYIKLKIQKACELIAMGNYTLKQISDALSYETFQYFSIQFKKVTGLSPSEFKAQVSADSDYLNIGFEKTGSSH